MNIRIALRMVKTLPLLACAATAIQAQAQTYNLTLLDGTDAGVSINNVGQVLVTNSFISAAIWSNGQTTLLDNMGQRFQLVFDLNNTGEVAGIASQRFARGSATIWSPDGHANLLTIPSYTTSIALGINDNHTVVGYASNDTGMHAAVWQGGVGSPLPGVFSSAANGINNAGQIVGYSNIGANAQAVLWQNANANPTSLASLPGTNESQAYATNDGGQIIGSSWQNTVINGANTIGKRIATLWSGNTVIELHNVADATGDTDVTGINAQGLTVGTSWIASGNSPAHSIATLWSRDGQSALDLNTLLDASAAKAGWALQTAYDINDQGAIVGRAFNSLTGETRGFLLTPVPEPTTAAYFTLGLIGIGAAIRRRQTKRAGAFSGASSLK